MVVLLRSHRLVGESRQQMAMTQSEYLGRHFGIVHNRTSSSRCHQYDSNISVYCGPLELVAAYRQLVSFENCLQILKGLAT